MIEAQAQGRATLEADVLGSLRVEQTVTLTELLTWFGDAEPGAVLSAAFALVYQGAATAGHVTRRINVSYGLA